MTEEVCASYDMLNALTGFGELVASTGIWIPFCSRHLNGSAN